MKMRCRFRFLPLSHIFERAWVAYVFHRGATNCYLEDTNYVRDALSTLKPTVMCALQISPARIAVSMANNIAAPTRLCIVIGRTA